MTLTRRGSIISGAALIAATGVKAQARPVTAQNPPGQGDRLMNTPINEADYIPVSAPSPFMQVSPIVFDVPGRQTPLQIKVSAPVSGRALPVLLFSHGHGSSTYLSSLHGYNPIAEFYAAHGFVVIQPTHQDSKALGLELTGPEGALFWRSRAQDMHHILDHLAAVEDAVPGLGGRLDPSKVVAAGHSMGGHTVCMLAGMRVTDPVDGRPWDLRDPRIKAAVAMAPPGMGGELAAFASEHYPVLRSNSFAEMTSPVLVVAGDQDQNDQFASRMDWRADAYALSPGPKSLLTMFGAKHSLGGISGYDVVETRDQDPERLGVVQRLTWAYLQSSLYPGDSAWRTAVAALASRPNPQGKIVTK